MAKDEILQKNEPSQEFLEKKKLLDMERDNIILKSELKMKELTYERQNNIFFHEKALERERIKNAEETKRILLKSQEIERNKYRNNKGFRQ